jgi:hypothetical protein
MCVGKFFCQIWRWFKLNWLAVAYLAHGRCSTRLLHHLGGVSIIRCPVDHKEEALWPLPLDKPISTSAVLPTRKYTQGSDENRG